MRKSRLDPGLNPRDWARANENDRQLNMERRVVTAIVRSTEDPACRLWLKRRDREERAGELIYGLDWLNRRSPVAFGTRKYAEDRSFAGVVSRLWKQSERDSLPEVAGFLDLVSGHPDDMDKVFVLKYPDHAQMYCITTMYVVQIFDDWPHAQMIFRLDGMDNNVALCPLAAVLREMYRRHGQGYLRLEGEA